MQSLVSRLWPFLFALLLFIGMSVLVRSNLTFFEDMLSDSFGGMAIFCAVTILMVMTPAASSIAMLPLASSLWGWPVAGLMMLCCWLIASQILFELSRRGAKGLVTKMAASKRMRGVQKMFTNANFPAMILARFVLPSDIGSYALALFTDVSSLQFFGITAAAMVVPAFAYAYLGSMSLGVQMLIIGGVGCGAFAVLLTSQWRSAKKRTKMAPHSANQPVV